jgi:hypothetical protein
MVVDIIQDPWVDIIRRNTHVLRPEPWLDRYKVIGDDVRLGVFREVCGRVELTWDGEGGGVRWWRAAPSQPPWEPVWREALFWRLERSGCFRWECVRRVCWRSLRSHFTRSWNVRRQSAIRRMGIEIESDSRDPAGLSNSGLLEGPVIGRCSGGSLSFGFGVRLLRHGSMPLCFLIMRTALSTSSCVI